MLKIFQSAFLLLFAISLNGQIKFNHLERCAEGQFLVANANGVLECQTIASMTLTSLGYDAATNTITYLDENLNPTVINLNEATITYNAATNQIVYLDEAGNPTTLTLNNSVVTSLNTGNPIAGHVSGNLDSVTIFETITNLVDNSNGTFSFTREDGTVQTISKSNLTDNLDGTYTFTNNDGSDVTIDIGDLETNTTIQDTVTGGNLIGTYANEDGTIYRIKETITGISLTDSIITYTDETGTGIELNLKPLIESCLPVETVTSLDSVSFTGNDIFIYYTNENGAQDVVSAQFPQETLTTITIESDTIRYEDEDGIITSLVITHPSETVTSITINNDTISYLDEDGVQTDIAINHPVDVLTSISIFNDTITYIDELGVLTTLPILHPQDILTSISIEGDTITYIDENGIPFPLVLNHPDDVVTAMSIFQDSVIRYTDELGDVSEINLCEVLRACDKDAVFQSFANKQGLDSLVITTSDGTVFTHNDTETSIIINEFDNKYSLDSNIVNIDQLPFVFNDVNTFGVSFVSSSIGIDSFGVSYGIGANLIQLADGTVFCIEKDLTSISINADTITYVDELGDSTFLVIDHPGATADILTSISIDQDTINYIDESGAITSLPINHPPDVVTSISIIGDTITYTNELGFTDSFLVSHPDIDSLIFNYIDTLDVVECADDHRVWFTDATGASEGENGTWGCDDDFKWLNDPASAIADSRTTNSDSTLEKRFISWGEITSKYLQSFIVDNDDDSRSLVFNPQNNFIDATTYGSIIGGGSSLENSIACTAFAGSTYRNSIGPNAHYSTLFGGDNSTNSLASTISGGAHNHLALGTDHSAVGGGSCNSILGGSEYARIGGGQDNEINGNSDYSTISGGRQGRIIDSDFATISGGFNNTSSADYATVSGGRGNTSSGLYSGIGYGLDNIASSAYAFAGGLNNQATGAIATILGGDNNVASGARSSVLSGNLNTASGDRSVVIGGLSNQATGTYSLTHGDNNIVAADRGGSFGSQNNNSGQFAFTFGQANVTTATGSLSFATGFGNTVNGTQSIALGTSNITDAGAPSSIALGARTRTSGLGAFAGGVGNAAGIEVTAGGEASFNFSQNLTGSAVAGEGSMGLRSFILGGVNQNVDALAINAGVIGGDSNKNFNPDSVIIGGTNYISSANDRDGFTYVQELAIHEIIEHVNDAAADADTGLPSGGLYTLVGSRIVHVKP